MFTSLRRLPGGLCLRGCLAILPLLLMLSSGAAHALSCSAGGTKAGSLKGGDGSVCYCDLNFQGKDYGQAMSPVGMGLPESSEAEEIGGELAGVALDESLGGGSGIFSYGTMVYSGSKSGGNIRYRDAVNTKICSDASCNSYITPAQYKDGVRYYFQNTSAGGGKQVFSCEWYGSSWLGQYYFKNARMDVPGVVDLMSPNLAYRYYTQYSAQNASGAIVPNQVTATDDVDTNPVVTCTPALSSYLPVGKNTISCTARDASGNVTGPVAFVTEVLKANQWAIFYPIDDIEFGESAPTLNVSLSSSLTPVYSASGPCSVNSSGVVSVTGTGNCAITATHPGNGYFNEASDGTQRFDIKPARLEQTITFDAVPAKTYGDPSFTLGVTGGGSGNPVKLTARSTYDVCFVTLPNTVSVYGAGNCKVEAYQDGNATHKPATAVLNIPVAKATVTLSLADVGEKTYGNPAFRVRATSSMPPYLLSYSTTGVCSNAGNLVTLTGVGTCGVTVALAGTAGYDATSATLAIPVLKGNQLINFPALNRASVSNAQLTLAATGGTSGEPMVYTATGTCSVTGNIVSFSEGQCEVTANQAGNANYNVAAPVSRSLVFAKANQTITFPAISSSSISGGQFPVSATGGASGEPVTYSVAGCSISGTTVTVTPGTLCNVTASQVGNVDYNAAADVTQSIQISASGAIVTNCNSTAVTGVSVGDCQALLALYNSTGGANWTTKTNWNTNSAVSTWFGIDEVVSQRVARINLSNNNLAGTLPTALGNLTALKGLSLSNNQLTGTIPSELGQLSATLQLLYLNGNKLSGEIPSQLGNLAQLIDLNFNGNRLSGSIPPQLGSLSKLTDLGLGWNQLTGTIPPQLGNLAATLNFDLELRNNRLTGTIPPEIGQLNKVQRLFLDYNQLSGTIPNLSGMTSMTVLSVGYNTLSAETSGTATARQANWRDTQTTPPTNITAVAAQTSVTLNWTPMIYQGVGGYYQVKYATTSGGPYDVAGVTTAKSSVSYTVNNLTPGTTYYFVVTGYTGGTIDVTSDPSAEISATTTALNQTQTLTFPTLGNLTPNDTQTLNASASSGLAVSYNVSGACSLSGDEVTATGAGTCTVTASQAGNGQYSAATSADRSFTIAKLAQAIEFAPLQEIAPGNSQTLSATASSGLTVSYNASGTCSLSGTQVTATSAGTCTVTASQAGNAQYNPASDVARSFEIAKIAQTLTFPALPDISYGQAAPTLAASVTPATLSVAYSASGVCTVTGSVLSITSAGTCTVTAAQPGDINHAAAESVVREFTVTQGSGSLAFDLIDNQSYADLSFTVTATRSGATGAISYASSTPAVCSVSGNTVNILQAGTCRLTAEQAADANYPAAQTSAEVVINPVALKVWVADDGIQEGSPLPTFSASYEGFVRSETEAVLSGTLAFTTTAPTPVVSGSYDINASGLSSPNYTISYLPGKLTVGGVGLLVTETQTPVVEGQSGTIGVVLTGQPSGAVTVTLTPDTFADLGAGIGKPVTVNFTAANWNVPQNVTVTPVDDTIPHGVKWSFVKATLNGNYSGVTEMTARTVIYDNDPGVIIQPYSAMLNVTEGGAATPYTLRLSSIPAQPVTVSLTPDARLQTDVASVTFAADETALAVQFINVTAVNDSVFSNLPALITHSISVGDGAGYSNALAILPVSVNIADNDPGVVITPLSVTATEGGATGSYTVNLSSTPASPVTVLLSYDSTQLAASQSQLIFTADASALTPQTITVTAVDDNVAEGAHSSSMSHSIKTGDGGFYPTSKPLDAVSVTIGDKAIPPPPPPAPVYYPEIQLLDSATDILDNSGKLDFGKTPVGTPVVKTLTIKNTGQAALTLGTPTLPMGFSVTNFPTSVAVGKSADFTLTMGASSAGNYTGKFSVSNNDRNENPFDFTLQGIVETPPVIIATATLTVSISGQGSVSGQGITCGADCTETLNVGSQIAGLTATPASGHQFDSWSDPTCGTGFSLNADTSCVASFSAIQTPPPPPSVATATLTVRISGQGSVNGQGIACGADCTETLTVGSQIAGLTVTPASGHQFDSWNTPACGTGFSLNADTSCVASFSKIQTPPPVVEVPTEPSLLGLIRELPGFDGLTISQTASGQLIFALPDASVITVFKPVNTEQLGTSQTPGYTLNKNGSLVLYLSNGLILKISPDLPVEADWTARLAEFGIAPMVRQPDGNWLINLPPDLRASFLPNWYMLRVADSTPLGLSVTPMPCDSVSLTLTFERQGMKYQQTFSPAIAEMSTVQAYVQQHFGLGLEQSWNGEVTTLPETAFTFYPHWAVTAGTSSGAFNLSFETDTRLVLNQADGSQQSLCITSPLPVR